MRTYLGFFWCCQKYNSERVVRQSRAPLHHGNDTRGASQRGGYLLGDNDTRPKAAARPIPWQPAFRRR